jgi:hypothetical protein
MPLTDAQERLEAIGDQLRAKIASKFAASTFLAGFAATILSGLVALLFETNGPPHLSKALGATLAATVLFVMGVIRFDELTMPKRFWPSRPGTSGDVVLLTMEDLWALHDRMVFFWRRLTLTGTALTGVAMMLVLVPAGARETARWAPFAWAGACAAAAFAYALWLDGRTPHRDELVRPED